MAEILLIFVSSQAESVQKKTWSLEASASHLFLSVIPARWDLIPNWNAHLWYLFVIPIEDIYLLHQSFHIIPHGNLWYKLLSFAKQLTIWSQVSPVIPTCDTSLWHYSAKYQHVISRWHQLVIIFLYYSGFWSWRGWWVQACLVGLAGHWPSGPLPARRVRLWLWLYLWWYIWLYIWW